MLEKFNSIFQQFFARFDEIIILGERLSTRPQFYEIMSFSQCLLIS